MRVRNQGESAVSLQLLEDGRLRVRDGLRASTRKLLAGDDEGDEDDGHTDEDEDVASGKLGEGHDAQGVRVSGALSMSPIIHIIGTASTVDEGNRGEISNLSAWE